MRKDWKELAEESAKACKNYDCGSPGEWDCDKSCRYAVKAYRNAPKDGAHNIAVGLLRNIIRTCGDRLCGSAADSRLSLEEWIEVQDFKKTKN